MSRQVLVVDDSLMMRRMVATMLQRLHFEVELAEDGASGVRLVAERAFAAVLMDCQMPLMDGFEATRAIRRAEAGGRHVPIIGLSASPYPEGLARCLAVGMDDFVPKPATLVDVAAVLGRWVPDMAGA